MPETDIPPGTDFAFDLGESILVRQSARVDSIDTKAAVVMGVDGVLAGLIFQGTFHSAPHVLVALAAVSLFCSLVAALFCFWTGEYAAAPEFDAVLERIEGREDWLKWRFLPNIADAIKTNHFKLERKALLLTTALTGLLVLIPLLGGYLIYANRLLG